MARLKKKKTEERNIEDVIEELKERFGEGAVIRLKEIRPAGVDVIPTGSISLDLALGVGGVPRGRVIEIFGPESSGKTTLALHIIAEAQKQGGVGAFIDAEHALDPEYAQKIGVNVEEILISQPDSGEQALEIVESLVRSGKVDVIVIDSVAALLPKMEIEGEMDDQQIGLQARLMSKALRKLSGIVSKTRTSVIFLNQTRMKIGIRFGSPETTPGGLALKFYSSVRIRLERIAKIKQGDRIIGSRIRAQIVKNKVAPPFKTAEFDIYYNEGISYLADLIKRGIKDKVISQKGAYYEYKDKKLGQGIEGAKEFLSKNPDLVEEIKKEILAKNLETSENA
jgi:recombination protein RecA